MLDARRETIDNALQFLQDARALLTLAGYTTSPHDLEKETKRCASVARDLVDEALKILIPEGTS